MPVKEGAKPLADNLIMVQPTVEKKQKGELVLVKHHLRQLFNTT